VNAYEFILYSDNNSSIRIKFKEPGWGLRALTIPKNQEDFLFLTNKALNCAFSAAGIFLIVFIRTRLSPFITC